MKCSIIEPVGGHGGMDYYDFGLSSGLTSAGVDVVLHTCDKTAIPNLAKYDVRHTYVGIFGSYSPLWRGGRFLAGSIKAMISSVAERRKIVHFHFFRVGVLALINVILARLMLRKVVITAHDVESFVSSLEVPIMSRVAYRLAHKIVAHNQISRDELVSRLKVAPEKICIIPHGNYLHALRPVDSVETSRQRLGISANAKVLLFFGQIKEVKGLDLLLKAMPSVLQEHPDTILLIAGKTWKTDFSVYQGMIDELNIGNACITHIRYINDDDVSDYYGSADLVVLPYKRIYQSGVVLMAMSYDKPVLVSDLPGMTEMVIDGDNGFVFRKDDSRDLAQKINIILGNRPLLATVAKRGRTLIEDKYSWESIGRYTARLYSEIGEY